MAFQIVFNNPLDADKFDQSQLAISPEIPGVKIIQNGGAISVQGFTKANTSYHVVVAGSLVDEFGQTLGQDTTLTFAVGDPSPTFFGPSGMVVIDPAANKPTLA